ncbi:hypothetical protein PIB30_005948 [Stylosanthes scabra]|uniref:Uncharacterized protein n=1 Tax=Stylosanthes scabra TaxID=79078 RepID=A0ABU6S4A8_9FABA|nr:hypothetical protein [Stylosanthes scabra]
MSGNLRFIGRMSSACSQLVAKILTALKLVGRVMIRNQDAYLQVPTFFFAWDLFRSTMNSLYDLNIVIWKDPKDGGCNLGMTMYWDVGLHSCSHTVILGRQFLHD